ncbi:glycosyltransferase family 2 protein [Flavobacterium sp. SLB02]|uniref:glycosyltransferase family 2 protein n=1 Tax=Flavobacterium sp. SLB02 TaxID=2665645 RepID=UPI0012AA91B7|nr:glycosyltransferase [Flavobacterium sp. SLB02]QGK76880.1 glycosyltransferase [Flavobacterium sp. SLB02]
MQASILIVTKNRKEELEITLKALAKQIDLSVHEVLVFLDGCTDDTISLKSTIPWVKWFSSEKSIGASAARNSLYLNAEGVFFIGLDDDAHPLNEDFVFKIESLFSKYPSVGILAFEEIKGIYLSDLHALKQTETKKKEYLSSEFIGCGFAIRKSVYNETNGFPVWVDIYGEESCLSIEVLSRGYDILYSNEIKVNHRVDREQRKANKQNYFRFGKQLKNSTYYFLVYYPYPLISILKLYWHNFKKYALSDFEYFKIYFKTIFIVLIHIPKILKYRNPVDENVIAKIKKTSILKY